MKFSKKILAAFLAALMAISMMPFTVFAAPPGSGDIGTGTSGGGITGDPIVVGNGNYLTFTGTDSFSIKTNNSAKNWNGTLQYSTDANAWTTWNGTQISSDNNVLYLRGTGNTRITGDTSNYWVITTQGTVACSGDIRTLLDYTEPESSDMGTYCFGYLFYNCTSLTAAPELPATILAEGCYSYMFAGCTNLTTAPELPATSLESYCYNSMFQNCTNLTTAPELPATILAEGCYSYMFAGCTNLTTAPELPATSLESYCYNSMFQNCTNLTTAPALPATSLESYCYNGMFQNCTNLTTAPALPATTLADECYSFMFYGCTSLTTPSELWATDLTNGCYYKMFRGCTGIKLSTEQTAEYSTPYSIPKGGTGTEGTFSLTDMFSGTGGTFTGTPTINTTYYIPAPAPTEPNNGASITVSFTKVSSADEITAENISTCSMEEAAAWIVANWDDIFDGEEYEYIDVAYYNSSTGCLDAFSISSDNNKKSFEDYYENFIYSDTSADNIKNWFETYGDTVYLCTPAAPAEPNNGASITVAETISENFYLDDEFYGETAYVTFTYNHNSNVSESAAVSTDVMAMSSLDDSTDGRKKFSITQAPAQATEPIAIKIYASEAAMNSGSDPIDTIDYSVYTYCRDIIENYNGEKAEEMKELAESTLDYAAAAQTYFGYNTDDMATKDNGGSFYNNVAGADFSSVAGVSAAPSCIKRASIVVKSDLEINLYSLTPIEVTGYNLEATKGGERFTATTGEKNGDYYCVHIAGIDAANMNKTFTVTTSEGPIIMTANTVIKMMAGSSNANLATLAKAMYLYGVAASEYFD